MVTRIIHKQVGNHIYLYTRVEHDTYLGKCPDDCDEHNAEKKTNKETKKNPSSKAS